MKEVRNKIWPVIFVLFLFGCRQPNVYEKYYEVKGSCWNKDSIATFHFEIKDTISRYDLSFNIRNQGNYPYSNLWVFIDIAAPDSTVLRDTFEIQLAAPNGKWLGNGTGGLYDLQQYYRGNIYFPKSGQYKVAVQQGMYSENNCLKGIHDFGIKLDKKKR
jgi:gliding motility-associated lipoprotein GldH